MSISEEITRLQGAKTTISEKMEALGVTEAGDLLDVIAEKIDGIEALSDLTTQLTPTKTQVTVGAGYTTGGTVSIDTESKTVTPTKAEQEITPTGSKVLTKVTVAKIPDAYQNVSTVDATAADVLSPKKFVNKDGTTVTGTIPTQGAPTSTLQAGDSYSITAGYYTGGKITAAPLASQTDGTATATDILEGKTAYVDGVKVTGEIGTIYDGDDDPKIGTGSSANSFHYTMSTATAGAHSTDTPDAYYFYTYLPKETYTGKINYLRVPADVVIDKLGLDTAKMLNTSTILGQTGTIVPRGALSKTMTGLTDDTDSVTISAGYYTGGTVSLTGDIEAALAAI